MPQPALHSDKPNIFKDEQEQWLGDAWAEQTDAEFDLLPSAESAELDRIGQKLLAQLPPTPMHFTFRVYDSDDANGFSIAGGHIYISRKLITDARSEDELAGVLAHEIGHIYTHQLAIEYTRYLKYELKVTSVSSREDVKDKFFLLFNAPWKDRAGESEDEEDKDELLADRVGMYAMIKAGYTPKAFAQNLDRVAANKGRTGNFLTDVLCGTNIISRRVRTARKMVAALPATCSSLQQKSSPEFTAFQSALRAAPLHPIVAPTPGLASFKLDPPVRTPLNHIRFSPDGNFVLAQDDSNIFVLSRSPLKLLFTIDAPHARAARFTPDSTHLVFLYPNLRVERWNVAEAKRDAAFELIDYEGCLQSSLSPDGKTFVCLSISEGGAWLKLTDVDTGNRFYENKTFNTGGDVASPVIITRQRTVERRVATINFSQDGKTLLILSGAKAFPYDLVSRKQIPLGQGLGSLVEGPNLFVDSNKLIFQCDQDAKTGTIKDTFKICESTFPDGLPLNQFKIGYQWLEPVTRGNHVLMGPFKEAAAMLADPSTGKATAGFKLDTLDVYDPWLATENERGGVSVGELTGQQMQSADLPISPLLNIEGADFSPDGRFLAYSSRSRSVIWDLDTHKRVALMRPFRRVHFSPENVMYAQYRDMQGQPGANYQIDLKTGKATAGAPYAAEQRQLGDVLVTFKPLDPAFEVVNTNLQVADGATGAQLWQRRFPADEPTMRESEDGTLVLSTPISDSVAQADINHPKAKLAKSSDWMNEWVSHALFVEVIDSRSGTIRQEFQVPQESGWDEQDRRWADEFGDFLVVHGNHNDSTIYRASNGERVGAFFGRVIAGDGKLGLLAATNRDQDILILDARNGNELKRITVDHIPLAARFIAQKNALLVLTANQTVITIDLPTAAK